MHLQVTLEAGDDQQEQCGDAFDSAPSTFALSALVPPGRQPWSNGAVALTPGSSAVASYLRSSRSSIDSVDWTDVDTQLLRLYALLGTDIAPWLPSATPASVLQPLTLAQSSSFATRAMGVAILAAESQLSSYLSIGSCMLSAAAPNATMPDILDSLASQLLGPSAATPVQLTSPVWALNALLAATGSVTSANITAILPDINTTAQVLASIAGSAEAVRSTAASIMAGANPTGGLDVLASLQVLSQIPPVQEDACAAVQANIVGQADLTAYLPATLPIALGAVSSASERRGRVFTTLRCLGVHLLASPVPWGARVCLSVDCYQLKRGTALDSLASLGRSCIKGAPCTAYSLHHMLLASGCT